MNDVLVKWTQKGAFQKDGEILTRVPGDQDVMSKSVARALEVVGQVRILGESKTVKALPAGGDFEVIEDELFGTG